MEQKTTPALTLTREEEKVRNEHIRLMCDMRQERDAPHPELDDMTYLQYYDSNRKKDLSYIPPKKNNNDIRIVTGTTREKDTTLLSSLLDLNLEANITAFDKENTIVNELGDSMGDLIKKSREIEEYDRDKSTIYREFVSQGDVFVQETWLDQFRPVSLGELDWNPMQKISEFTSKEKMQKIFSYAKSRMISGKKIYLGSMRIENIKDQPYVAVMNTYKRSTAQARYGTWERWQYVPHDVATTEFTEDTSGVYHDWNLATVNDGDVSEIFFYLPLQNRFAIYLNGIPMLPHNYPLDAVSPSGEIPIAQGKLEPISNFAYSKSQPSKLKIDQEVIDEVTKLFITAFRQTRRPPMGNMTNKVLGSSIFDPGKITPSVTKDQLFPLLPEGSRGLNQADFSFYQLFKESMGDKSVNDVFAGQGGANDVNTLGQSQMLQQQQVLKLGLALDGIMNLEKQMHWNRLHTILFKWTKQDDNNATATQDAVRDMYKNITVDTTLENGEGGIKMFKLSTDPYPDVQDQEQEEEDLTEEYGKPVRIIHMNPEVLRTVRYTWFIQIRSSQKSGSPLERLTFIQNIREAIELFGYENINVDYAKQIYAIKNDLNYAKFFTQGGTMQAILGQQQTPIAKANTPQIAGKKPLQAQVR